MKNKKVLIILALILIVGLFLRVHKLGDESFWIDETATVYTTQQNTRDIIDDIYTTTIHAPEYFESGGTPPFYFLVANYWTKIVGLSEAKLRFLSVIFGIISIYFIFLIGKMIFDYRVGLVSAFILSINYLHINYSQEARTYSLVILLTLLTVYFLLNALKQKKASYWIAYVLSGTLLIYTHYFGVFVLIFEYLFLLIFWKEYRKSLKSIILSGIGIFILYAPWMPVLLRQIAESGYLVNYLGQNIIYDLARIFVQFNSWFTPDLETRIALRAVYHSISDYTKLNLSSVTALGWLTIISVLLLTLLLTWFFVVSIFTKDKKITLNNLKDKKYLFLLMWFLVPIFSLIVITIMLPQSPIFGFVQHIIFVLPGYILIVAVGVIKTKKTRSLLILLIILSIIPLHSYYANFNKQQWREAAEYLENNKKFDELVIINKANHILPLSYYYKDTGNVIGIKNVDELVHNIDKEDSFWFVYTSEKYGDPGGVIKRYIDLNYESDKTVEFTGIKIFHYIS